MTNVPVFMSMACVDLWVTFGIKSATTAEPWLVPANMQNNFQALVTFVKQINSFSCNSTLLVATGMQQPLYQTHTYGFASSQQTKGTVSRSGAPM